jgi:hypothetical protein
MKKTLLSVLISVMLALSPTLNAQNCVIPVIIHVIHGGQAPGTYPNLAQGQLNSQIQVLNDDHAGIGLNSGTYPSTAFTTWATNTFVTASSIDGMGRIKIANTNVTFCLALKDSMGNTLTEPGIDRVDYNTLPALTGTYTSKNPANPVYNNLSKFQGFMDGYIKPNTIWNCSKYYNIWVSDVSSAVGLLGFSTFPPNSTLPGILSYFGTKTTDGTWIWAKTFGSSTIFPGGTYQAPWDKGRACTHETGHWLGLLHSYSCPTNDYCNDTPPGSSTLMTPATCSTTYPFLPGTCSSFPTNSPDGQMYMNFMDVSDDCAMYMFTQDQANRMNTARINSPYRKLLGTHGLCPTSCALSVNGIRRSANFALYPNPASNYFIVGLEKKENVKIEIMDAVGKIVMEKSSSDSETIKINTSSFSKGIYFVNVSGMDFKEIKKLIIE